MTLRRFALRAAAAAAMLAVVSSPALAQRTGTKIGRTAGKDDGEAALAIIADCLLKRHPALAAKWLGMLPGTAEERALLNGISDDLGICMSRDRLLVLDSKRVGFQPVSLRIPIATALAIRALASLPRSFAPGPAAQPWFEAKLKAHPAGARIDQVSLARDDYGHCVATRRWAGSRDLLLSKPGSPQEKDAIRRLVPVLGPCLTEGSTLQLTPANIRLMLAQPVYHLATGAKS
jgi:hypothetical protein